MSKSLFDNMEEQNRKSMRPLAARMRPLSLDEFVGQQHFAGEGKLLRRLLAANRLGSIILFGPPGTGKTTLAHLLALESKSRFRELSAVASGVSDLRAILTDARDELAASGMQTLVFIDEIHRFNKAQQDVLLHDVEDGVIALVGATTSNPFFAVNRALVSRSQIFEFHPISEEDIFQLLTRVVLAMLRSRSRRERSSGLQSFAMVTRGERCLFWRLPFSRQRGDRLS